MLQRGLEERCWCTGTIMSLILRTRCIWQDISLECSRLGFTCAQEYHRSWRMWVPCQFSLSLSPFLAQIVHICPSIHSQFMRCSVEGLSLYMFILAVLGNVTYGLGILLYSVDSIFLLQKLPWLVGSVGTLCFDITVSLLDLTNLCTPERERERERERDHCIVYVGREGGLAFLLIYIILGTLTLAFCLFSLTDHLAPGYTMLRSSSSS